MAAIAVSTDAIAITEKKMDMTLEDIIKMSKKVASKGIRHPRASNKSPCFLKDRGAQHNSNVQRFMKPLSSFRQGVLTQDYSCSVTKECCQRKLSRVVCTEGKIYHQEEETQVYGRSLCKHEGAEDANNEASDGSCPQTGRHSKT